MSAPNAGGRWLRRLRDAALILLLSVVGLLLLEGLVRLVAPQVRVTAHRSVGETLGDAHPVLGHVLRAGADSVTRDPEFTARYRTSVQGLRDRAVYDPRPAPGVTRVLVLGDSFTFGEASDYDAIWPVRLESALRAEGLAIELVKSGVPGYDTRKALLLLRARAAQFAPDVVLHLFVPNDLFTNEPVGDALAAPIGSPAAPAAPASPAPAPSETATPAPSALSAQAARSRDVETLRQAKRRRPPSHLVRWLQRRLLGVDALYVRLYARSMRGGYFVAAPTGASADAYAVTAALLRAMRDEAARHGARLVVASLPQQAQLFVAADTADAAPTASGASFDPDAVDRQLGAAAAALDVPWLALLPALAADYRAHGEDLYHRRDGHLNARGNAVVAAALAAQLPAVLAAESPMRSAVLLGQIMDGSAIAQRAVAREAADGSNAG
ncbi:MAG: GDSL-type esterase/lipase family protein [Acidobacteriota bacterium]